MKLLNYFFTASVALFIANSAQSQCPEITCPTDISTNNDNGECGAVVNFTPPEGIDPCASGSQTFNFTGSAQTFTVPAGVTEVSIEVYGGQGGSGGCYSSCPNASTGGLGGFASGTLVVSPGDILNVYVGGEGEGYPLPSTLMDGNTPKLGGWNGGGNSCCYHGTGGGGATDIRYTGTNLTDRVIVAGGGGGGGNAESAIILSNGGSGGGLSGETMPNNTQFLNRVPGTGGTQTGGWNLGVGQNATDNLSGGGGGGYWGGTSGDNSTGGGGGSSFIGGVTGGITNMGVNSGNGYAVISWSGIAATTTQTAGLASGAAFPVGITTQTYEAVDGFGNTASCSFTIEVVDAEDPTITAPAAVNTSTDANSCEATVALGTPTTADNCAVNSVTNDAPAAFPIGVTTVTWTVTDDAGNTATATQVITVVDDVNPTITAPADLSVSADANSCEATGVTLGTAVTDDNCTVNSVTNDAPTTFPAGATTVTWTVTDDAGNTATTTQIVTVNDDEEPVVADCPADISTPVSAQNCEATASWTAPTATDNCTTTLNETASHNPGDLFPVGITNVTYDYTDDAGNTATCAFTIEVISDLEATATSNDIMMGNDGTVDLTVTGGAPNYSFSWEGPNGFTSTDQNLTDLDDPGLYTVTITDENGCEYVVEIFVESRVGVAQIDVNNVNVYPNPNNGSFTVDFGANKEKVSIQVIDVQGRIVKEQTFNNTDKGQMNLKAQKGVYTLRIDADGQLMNRKIALK